MILGYVVFLCGLLLLVVFLVIIFCKNGKFFLGGNDFLIELFLFGENFF